MVKTFKPYPNYKMIRSRGEVSTNVINPRNAISRKKEFKTTLIKKGATNGANATILCGNMIHEYPFICTFAVVTNSLERNSLMETRRVIELGIG